MKKNNQRTCIVTKIVQDKTNLIRIVMTNTGNFKVNSNTQGRGAYISKNTSLIKKIIKNKVLHKAFRTAVPNKVYDELIKVIQGG